MEYFNKAKELTDELFVIVNSDVQRALKGSKEFQKEAERLIIVQNIKAVDKAMISVDQDRTVCASIRSIFETYGQEYQIGFANGGIRTTIPFLKPQFVKN